MNTKFYWKEHSVIFLSEKIEVNKHNLRVRSKSVKSKSVRKYLCQFQEFVFFS